MTTGEADSAAQTRAGRLQFDRYVLDLNRGSLLLDGNEIALRPKTFAVLRHLIENSGRLVSKDELFAAVWPNLTVTDDALVQSIGELRRALGDDGSRLIRTVPRRGYRFEAAVSAGAAVEPSAADTMPGFGDFPGCRSSAEACHPGSGSNVHDGARGLAPAIIRRSGSGDPACRWGAVDRPRPRLELAPYPGLSRSIRGKCRNRRETRDCRASLPERGRRSGSRVFRGRVDAGHHQRAGSVFRADGHVVERRFSVQGQTGEPGRDRPRSCRGLPDRRQRPGDRGPGAGDRAAGRRGWPGAVVGAVRRGARGPLYAARSDRHSDRQGLADPCDTERAAARVRQADRKP